MLKRIESAGKTGSVVEEKPVLLFNGVSSTLSTRKNPWHKAICMLLAMLLSMTVGLWITPYAHAENAADSDASSVQTNDATMTDNITDTQNLLGANMAQITDAMSETLDKTGVTVRLLYLENFDDDEKPAQWVQEVLQSVNPVANTVMLAVASGDGNLVVAVSSNSDDWLKSQKTVDDLSSVAAEPLTQNTPDWAGSALAMMDEIVSIKQHAESMRTTIIAVASIVGAVVVVAVALVGIVMWRSRRKGKGASRHSRRARRSAARKITKKDSEDIQETSSESRDAGQHEQTN